MTLVKPGTIDLCRARGCGSYLGGIGTTVGDGQIAYCVACKREHTFHVYENGGSVYVEIERKKSTKKGGKR